MNIVPEWYVIVLSKRIVCLQIVIHVNAFEYSMSVGSLQKKPLQGLSHLPPVVMTAEVMLKLDRDKSDSSDFNSYGHTQGVT